MMANDGSLSSKRVLVVEDEESIGDIVATALGHHGALVTLVVDGLDGLACLRREAFDLVVLDVMLPGLSGFEICRRIREEGNGVPVMFLTARIEASDRVDGFVVGADDYLTKPFSVDELVLRVAAILRRSGDVAERTERVTLGDLVLDLAAKEVRRGEAAIDLSPTEFGLLHYLMVNQNIVVSKAQILANVWDDDFDGSENVVELYVGYLRRKIDTGRTPLIHTRRGVGYVMRMSP